MAVSWDRNPEILTNANVIPDTVDVEIPKPVRSDKLSVSEQAINGVNPKMINETLHELNALAGGWVAELGHHPEQDGKSNALVNNGKDKDVDVCRSKLPVGSIHGQPIRGLMRQQSEYEAGDKVGVKQVLRHETLNSAQGGVNPNVCIEADRQLLEANGLNLAKRTDKQAKELNSG